MQIMLSEHQQKSVWEGWLGAEIRAHYFADLCHSYQRDQRTITWLLLAASSGAVAAALPTLPPSLLWLRTILPIAIAGLSLWSLVATYNKHATDCLELHFGWHTLSNDYEALWEDMYSQHARTTLANLRRREADLSKNAPSLPNDEDLMRKWQHHVLQQRGLESPV